MTEMREGRMAIDEAGHESTTASSAKGPRP